MHGNRGRLDAAAVHDLKRRGFSSALLPSPTTRANTCLCLPRLLPWRGTCVVFSACDAAGPRGELDPTATHRRRRVDRNTRRSLREPLRARAVQCVAHPANLQRRMCDPNSARQVAFTLQPANRRSRTSAPHAAPTNPACDSLNGLHRASQTVAKRDPCLANTPRPALGKQTKALIVGAVAPGLAGVVDQRGEQPQAHLRTIGQVPAST